MNWVTLAFAVIYSWSVIINLKVASGRGKWSTYNAAASAVGFVLNTVIAGFSVYFWKIGLVPQMNWFFVAVLVWSILVAGLAMMSIGRHGQRSWTSAGVSAFAAILSTVISAGFYYVFLVLTF